MAEPSAAARILTSTMMTSPTVTIPPPTELLSKSKQRGGLREEETCITTVISKEEKQGSHLFLSNDFVIEILSYLPAKSLLRFKCVCNAWCDLINNPAFISLNLQRSALIKDNSRIIALRSDRASRPKRSLSVLSLEPLASRKVDILPFRMPRKEVYGPCNGIVCLYSINTLQVRDGVATGDDIIVLLNPATGEFKVLPLSLVPHPKKDLDSVRIGFGFDPIVKDYKVIKILLYRNCGYLRVPVPEYDVQAKLRCTVLGRTVGERGTAYMNGVHYWLDYDDGVSFDMNSEVFGMLPKVEVYRPDRRLICGTSITVLDDSLALVGTTLYSDPGEYHVWVLKENNGISTWMHKEIIRHCSFRYPVLYRSFLGFSVNGEALFKFEDLLCYDRRTKEIKLYGVRKLKKVTKFAIYTESLVKLDGTHGSK